MDLVLVIAVAAILLWVSVLFHDPTVRMWRRRTRSRTKTRSHRPRHAETPDLVAVLAARQSEAQTVSRNLDFLPSRE